MMVPGVDEIKRGKKAKLPESRWLAALEAVRNDMAKNVDDMTLKEDRRDGGQHETHILRYRHGRNGLDITLVRHNTPRETGEALRICDRHVSVRSVNILSPGDFRLKGVGDEAYVYRRSGSVIMCYSNVFAVINGQSADLKAKAAKVLAVALEKAAEQGVRNTITAQ